MNWPPIVINLQDIGSKYTLHECKRWLRIIETTNRQTAKNGRRTPHMPSNIYTFNHQLIICSLLHFWRSFPFAHRFDLYRAAASARFYVRRFFACTCQLHVINSTKIIALDFCACFNLDSHSEVARAKPRETARTRERKLIFIVSYVYQPTSRQILLCYISGEKSILPTHCQSVVVVDARNSIAKK